MHALLIIYNHSILSVGKSSAFNLERSSSVMFGSEASGLSEELKNYATKNVTIEMSDRVESLNLSMSVGIILYKVR